LPNVRTDVEAVQRLLNNASNHRLIRLVARLVPDGRFGAKTEAAIIASESALLGRLPPKGTISKNGDVVRALTQTLPLGFSAQFLSLAMLNASDEQVARLAGPIASIFTKYDLNSPLRQAHFLAQIGHESGELRFQEELATGAAYEGRTDLGNTEPGHGRRFKGRGLIQLTGRANYTAFAREIDREEEIMANPSLVATELDLCVGAAAWYWNTRGLNRFADDDKLRTVTRRVNGGYNGLAHRRELLIRCKALFGLA
jgi:predicted chitinase